MTSVGDAYYVPVDQRWLGLDKRKFPIAAVILGVLGIMLWVMPAINDAVDWDDPTVAGDVIDMGASTFVPPTGWELYSGVRTTDEVTGGVTARSAVAQLGGGGVSIVVRSSGFDGSAAELLEQSDRIRTRSGADPDDAFTVTSEAETVTTDSGLTGVSETFTTATGGGRTVAFTFDDTAGGNGPIGLLIDVEGDDSALAANAEEITAFLDSVTVKEQGS